MTAIAATARPISVKRTYLRSLIAAGGIAIGAMLLAAPAAHGEMSGVQYLCNLSGGNYTKDSAGVESCCYGYDIDGQGHHCRVWVAGVYTGVYNGQPPSPGTPPNPKVPTGVVHPTPIGKPPINAGGGNNPPGGLQ